MAKKSLSKNLSDLVDPQTIELLSQAETNKIIYMVEAKSRTEMTDPEVLAKKEAAVRWCFHASLHAQTCGGKPWKYVLVPHDAIAENMTLDVLARQFVSH
jgi:type III restriction enzyme